FFKDKTSSLSKTLPKQKVEDKENQIKELEKQKKQVLSAIKRVEQELKDELISKEDYNRLRSTYKKRAINILKEIDALEEKKNE
ncbi:MAG: hypothetical protein ACXABJ_07770, partial [Candidatus Heimdallarchaeaceae archaeon]